MNLFGVVSTWKKYFRYSSSFANHFFDLRQAAIFQHALATPLSVLEMNLSLIKVSELPEVQVEAVARAQAATTHLIQLLAYLSPNYQAKECFELQSVLKRLIALHSTPEKRVIYHGSRSEVGVWLAGDEVLFLEALNCLISNAFAAYQEQTGVKTIILSCLAHNQRLEINLVDFGQGMTNQQIRNIFAIKTISSKQVRGIGLPFAKHIVETQLNGRLEIESFPNYGTKIDIHLPILVASNL